MQPEVAQRWLERTGSPICEGYGLSEASPSVSCNPVLGGEFDGSIGMPLPGTEMMCVDEAGAEILGPARRDRDPRPAADGDMLGEFKSLPCVSMDDMAAGIVIGAAVGSIVEVLMMMRSVRSPVFAAGCVDF